MGLERCIAVTLSDEVFQALVKAILSGEIEPGARLDELRKYDRYRLGAPVVFWWVFVLYFLG